MPDFDFDAFNHDNVPAEGSEGREFAPENNEIKASESPAKDDEPVTSSTGIAEAATPEIDTKVDDEEVDKW